MISEYYKRYLIFSIINSISALIGGIILYFLGRTSVLDGAPLLLRLIFEELSFYFPDALWAYALLFALSTINDIGTSAVLTFICGLTWELLQKFGIMPGTYDYLDLYLYLVAIIIAIIIIKFWRNRNEKYLT